MRLLWYLLPDSAMPLVIVVVALFLIVGVLKRGAALSIIGAVLVYWRICSLLLSSAWFSICCPGGYRRLLIVFVMSFLRALSSFILGDRASDHMVGILAAVSRFQIAVDDAALMGMLDRFANLDHQPESLAQVEMVRRCVLD